MHDQTRRIPDRLAALIREARSRARGSARGVLVSLVEPAGEVDPLAALAQAEHASRGGSALAVEARTRCWWERPADGFALAGVGAAVTLEASGDDRFGLIDREWRALRDTAVVDDQTGGAEGAGPALVGGFAFEPDGPRTDRWRGFAAASMVVPRIQIAAGKRGAWLTTNVIVKPDGDADVDLDALAALRASVLSARSGAALHDASAPPPPIAYADARPAAAWRETVGDAVRAIHDGAFTKVVLAREVRAVAPRPFDALATLEHLRVAHPGCFVFAFWRGNAVFIGATPERLVSLAGNAVRASSLAGSVSRGASAAEDAALGAGLMASVKDREEHEVVRRELCAALATVCDDVSAAATPTLLSLPQVHHLHTDVRATLRAGHSFLELAQRLHPTPAVGGEPRDDALRFIRQHEALDRGWYAAPIGWLQRERGELAVALRCALVRGAEASLFAGCGIVADSEPGAEYAESLLKLRPMELALGSAVAAAGGSRPVRAAASGRTAR